MKHPFDPPGEHSTSEENPFPEFTVPPNPQQSEAVNWKIMDEETTPPIDAFQETTTDKELDDQTEYYPLSDTIRLYAGWQLALYVMVYALGFYQLNEKVSFRVPYIDALFISPILLTATLGCFLFLACTEITRMFPNKTTLKIFVSLLFIVLFVFYRSNV